MDIFATMKSSKRTNELKKAFQERSVAIRSNWKSFKYLMMKKKHKQREKYRTKNLRSQLESHNVLNKENKMISWRLIAKKLKKLKNLMRKKTQDSQKHMSLRKTPSKAWLKNKYSSSTLSFKLHARKLDWKTVILPEKRETFFLVALRNGVRCKRREGSKNER